MRERLGVVVLALGLPVILLLGSMITASAASATTYGPPDQCLAGYGGCILYNLDNWDNSGGLGIYEGNGHNEPIQGEPYPNSDGVSWVNKDDNIWGWMQSNLDGECWNESGGKIYLDSCQNGDGNEYFDFVQVGNYWEIHCYAEGNTLNVATDNGSGTAASDLYFTSGVNDTSEWYDD